MTKRPTKKSLKIWIEPERHEEIKKAAEADRRTISAWVMVQVDKALDDAKAIERAIEDAKRKK
jgi:uncharacterized protein (DUF1778 family)